MYRFLRERVIVEYGAMFIARCGKHVYACIVVLGFYRFNCHAYLGLVVVADGNPMAFLLLLKKSRNSKTSIYIYTYINQTNLSCKE